MKRDGVSLEALGRSWTLRFSTNAFCDLEDATGLGVTKIVETLQTDPSVRFIRTCFWATLRQDTPELTLEQAGDVVDEIGFVHAAALLGEAFAAAFPSQVETDESAEGNGAKATDGTGTNS